MNFLSHIAVGAGSAGSVVASRLTEIPCVRVLLLEAGKKPPLLTEVPAFARAFWFTSIDWKYKTTPQKHTGDQLINRVNIYFFFRKIRCINKDLFFFFHCTR